MSRRRNIACAVRIGIVAAALVLYLPAGAAFASEDGLYGGDIGQAIATWVIFALLLVILGRFAWKPVIQQLRTREEAISNAIEQAETRGKQAEDLLAHYRARLDAAGQEAEELLADSRKEAADAREQLLALAKEKAHDFAEKAAEEIAEAKSAAVSELRAEAAEMAADIAAKVLGRALGADEHRRLVDDAMEQITSVSGKN